MEREKKKGGGGFAGSYPECGNAVSAFERLRCTQSVFRGPGEAAQDGGLPWEFLERFDEISSCEIRAPRPRPRPSPAGKARSPFDLRPVLSKRRSPLRQPPRVLRSPPLLNLSRRSRTLKERLFCRSVGSSPGSEFDAFIPLRSLKFRRRVWTVKLNDRGRAPRLNEPPVRPSVRPSVTFL